MTECSFLAFSRTLLSHRARATIELFSEAAVGRSNRLVGEILVGDPSISVRKKLFM